MTGIPVLAAPAIDPGSARIEMTLPEGLTLDAIVAAALPGASAADLERAVQVLVRGLDREEINGRLWIVELDRLRIHQPMP